MSIDILDMNLPVLLGLDVLESYKMCGSNAIDGLIFTASRHKHAVSRKYRYMFLSGNPASSKLKINQK